MSSTYTTHSHVIPYFWHRQVDLQKRESWKLSVWAENHLNRKMTEERRGEHVGCHPPESRDSGVSRLEKLKLPWRCQWQEETGAAAAKNLSAQARRRGALDSSSDSCWVSGTERQRLLTLFRTQAHKTKCPAGAAADVWLSLHHPGHGALLGNTTGQVSRHSLHSGF